jgi:hypothetical protein
MKVLFLSVMFLVSSCATRNNYSSNANKFDDMLADMASYPISEEISNPEHKKQFVRDVCNGKNDNACGRAGRKMVWDKFLAYYNGADPSYVDQKCIATKDKCENWKFMEDLFKESHNARVEQMRAEHNQNIANAQQEKSSQMWRALATGFQNMAQQQQNQRIQEQEALRQQQERERLNAPIQTHCRQTQWGLDCTTRRGE